MEAWKILQGAQLTDASTSQAALREEQGANSTTSSPSSVAISIGASGRRLRNFTMRVPTVNAPMCAEPLLKFQIT